MLAVLSVRPCCVDLINKIDQTRLIKLFLLFFTSPILKYQAAHTHRLKAPNCAYFTGLSMLGSDLVADQSDGSHDYSSDCSSAYSSDYNSDCSSEGCTWSDID